MSNIIILYDIIGGPVRETPFSPNVWKTRYALNYKGLPYKVVWVDGSDIDSVCKRIGAKPTSVKKDGSPWYTLPVIHDLTTDTVVSESAIIAEYLDRVYPSTPVLFPVGTRALQHAFVEACAAVILAGLRPFGREWFARTKEIRLGLERGESDPSWLQREENWQKTKGGLDTINMWLEKSGTYVMGDTISFADIVLAALVNWIKRVVGEDSKEWEEMRSLHGGRWETILSNFEKYGAVVA